MNILITAGGTREDIDAVRGITNYATGRLGSLIADEFAKNNAIITYVCCEDSDLPNAKVDVTLVRSAQELLETVETLMKNKSFDCVIHSMAVSDYTPKAVMTLDGKPLGQNKKISSDNSEIMIYLKQTPKIIGRIKELQPKTLLVGFKLLLDVAEDELLEAAWALMDKNSCDFVLANDLKHIKGDMHKGILIDTEGIAGRAKTKQEIAEMIYKAIKERFEKL